MITTAEIRNELKTGGIARKNRYHVEIPIPRKVQDAFIEAGLWLDSRTLSLRCFSTQLPPKSIASTDTRIGGVNEKIPYSRTYDDVTMTFIVDKKMDIKKLFDIWQDVIAPDDFSHVSYLDDITSTVGVHHLSNSESIEYSLFLTSAFPIVVNSLDYSGEDSDSFQSLGVTWAFRTVKRDLGSKPQPLPALPELSSADKNGFNISAVMEFLNDVSMFSLEGEAARWFEKINDFIRGFTGGYGINSMKGLVKRMEFMIDNNSRILDTDRSRILLALAALRKKLGF